MSNKFKNPAENLKGNQKLVTVDSKGREDTLHESEEIDPTEDYHYIPETHQQEPYKVGNFVNQQKPVIHDDRLQDYNVQLDSVPMYVDFIQQFNFSKNPAAHALLTYALHLGSALESPENADAEITAGALAHKVIQPKQMLKTICLLYNEKPEKVIKFWDEVDRMLDILNLAPIPFTTEYRHVKLNINGLEAIVRSLTGEKKNLSSKKE